MASSALVLVVAVCFAGQYVVGHGDLATRVAALGFGGAATTIHKGLDALGSDLALSETHLAVPTNANSATSKVLLYRKDPQSGDFPTTETLSISIPGASAIALSQTHLAVGRCAPVPCARIIVVGSILQNDANFRRPMCSKRACLPFGRSAMGTRARSTGTDLDPCLSTT